MLTHILKKAAFKTPSQNHHNITKSLSELTPDLFLDILSSPYIGEGVYCIEHANDGEKNKIYLTTPSFYRNLHGKESIFNLKMLENDLKTTTFYDISLSKPSFLPLYTTEYLNLLEQLTLFNSDTVKVYTQFLFCKRNDYWQETAIQQYEKYLLGIDYPVSSKLGRKLQSKVMVFVDRITESSSQRDSIPDIENKILEDNYRFELRVLLHTTDQTQLKLIEQEIKDVLTEYTLFNDLSLNPIKQKDNHFSMIINRKFSSLSSDNMISLSELSSFVFLDNLLQNTAQNASNNQPAISAVQEIEYEVDSDIENESSDKPNKHNTHLLPQNPINYHEFQEELVEQIAEALKRVKVIKNQKINVIEKEKGATVSRVTVKIPKEITYTDIEKNLKNLRAAMGTDIEVERGKEANTINFLIPCDQREAIYLRELLESEEFTEFAKENTLPFVAGIDMYNKPVLKCLTEAPHLLVTGATGSGKSVFINALIMSIVLFRKTKEVMFYLIDPKLVEFSQYRGLTHVQEVITDLQQSADVLKSLVKEMDRRYEQMSKVEGCKKISTYNKKSKRKLPYIVCIVDEYADLIMQFPSIEEDIMRITQKARASGIHLILGTQRPSTDIVTGVIKSNIPSRISFKLVSSSDYKTVFGKTIPYNLLGRGDGVVMYNGQQEEFIRFQSPCISIDEDEAEASLDLIKSHYNGDKPKGIELVESEPEEEPIDKLKRIVAETGETRTRQLQDQLKVSNNTVAQLKQQLVDEGWLTRDESTNKYVIAAPEGELAKYLKN